MSLTQSKLTVGDLIFDARLCGPEGGAVVVLLHELAGVLQLVAG